MSAILSNSDGDATISKCNGTRMISHNMQRATWARYHSAGIVLICSDMEHGTCLVEGVIGGKYYRRTYFDTIYNTRQASQLAGTFLREVQRG